MVRDLVRYIGRRALRSRPQAAQADNSSHDRVVIVIRDVAELAVPEENVDDQNKEQFGELEVASGAQVTKTVAKLFLQIQAVEEELEQHQSAGR